MRRGLPSHLREGSASPVGSWKEGWGLRERGSLTKAQLENVFWELGRKAQKSSPPPLVASPASSFRGGREGA